MNFEDYVKNMSQKYKIAVAIAVLRSKPEEITTEQYICQLQEKIRGTDMEEFICSDDFHEEDFNIETSGIFDDIFTNIDDNSINVLENFENAIKIKTLGNKTLIQDETKNMSNIEGISFVHVLRDIDDNENVMEQFQGTDCDTQMTYWEQSQDIITPNLNNLAVDNQIIINCDKIDPIIDFNNYNHTTHNNTQMNEQKSKLAATVSKNLNKQFTNAKEHCNKGKKIGDFEENLSINADNITTDNILDNVIHVNNNADTMNEINMETTAKKDFISDKARKIAKNIENERNIIKETAKKRPEIFSNITFNNNERSNLTIYDKAVTDHHFDSQDTIFYTVPGFTQPASQISQSQFQNIEIPKNFITGNKRVILNQSNLNQNEAVSFSQSSVVRAKDSNKIEYIIDENGKKYAVLHQIELNNHSSATIHQQNDQNALHHDGTSSEHNNLTIKHIATVTEHDIMDIDYAENIEFPENITFQSEHNKNIEQQKTITEQNVNSQENEANSELTETENSQVVPFKVVKELSKIKTYLERKERGLNTEGYSTDSGYRSDSQHSTFKTVSNRDTWVQQSAQCLYNYVVKCPLVASTQDILADISLALGGLIDKMHEEESYPVFLEELLTTADSLLKEIYKEGGENILLEKDQKIQRLLLLNQSTHILRFSLEKTTLILQEIYNELTSKENLYELKNVLEVENITYIFYILEIFLQKYMKVKHNLSQNTQNSQKVLKKSSIADIWRKKWNLTKETKFEGSIEKVCVLRKIGDVLNKIVVDCMEGYSLISFSALQCFNLLQNS